MGRDIIDISRNMVNYERCYMEDAVDTYSGFVQCGSRRAASESDLRTSSYASVVLKAMDQPRNISEMPLTHPGKKIFDALFIVRTSFQGLPLRTGRRMGLQTSTHFLAGPARMGSRWMPMPRRGVSHQSKWQICVMRHVLTVSHFHSDWNLGKTMPHAQTVTPAAISSICYGRSIGRW